MSVDLAELALKRRILVHRRVLKRKRPEMQPHNQLKIGYRWVVRGQIIADSRQVKKQLVMVVYQRSFHYFVSTSDSKKLVDGGGRRRKTKETVSNISHFVR